MHKQSLRWRHGWRCRENLQLNPVVVLEAGPSTATRLGLCSFIHAAAGIIVDSSSEWIDAIPFEGFQCFGTKPAYHRIGWFTS